MFIYSGCGAQISAEQALNGHQTFCIANPDRDENIAKLTEAINESVKSDKSICGEKDRKLYECQLKADS